MRILLNGEVEEIKEGETLQDLFGDYTAVAVAVDAHVVPRKVWGEWILKENARVDVVTPFQGG